MGVARGDQRTPLFTVQVFRSWNTLVADHWQKEQALNNQPALHNSNFHPTAICKFQRALNIFTSTKYFAINRHSFSYEYYVNKGQFIILGGIINE